MLKKHDQNSSKLKEFEAILIEFFQDIGKLRRQPPIMAKILGYLRIYDFLTISQLKLLTKNSHGSISSNVKILTSLGFLNKNLIPGTHTFQYYRPKDATHLSQDIIQGLINDSQKIQSIIKLHLESLNKNMESVGTLNLIESLKELHYSLDEFLNFVRFFSNVLKSQSFDDVILKSNQKLPSYLEEKQISTCCTDVDKYLYTKKSSEVLRIESEIVELLINSYLFSSRNKLRAKIICYFFLRKVLTQEILRECTGLSLGKISYEIRALIEFGSIILVGKTNKSKKVYCLVSIKQSIFNILYNTLIKTVEWEPKFKTMLSELEINQNELKSLNQFQNISNLIKYYLSLISRYKILLHSK